MSAAACPTTPPVISGGNQDDEFPEPCGPGPLITDEWYRAWKRLHAPTLERMVAWAEQPLPRLPWAAFLARWNAGAET